MTRTSSAHSSVVWRHVEGLLDLSLTTKKLVRLKVFRQGPRQGLIDTQVKCCCAQCYHGTFCYSMDRPLSFFLHTWPAWDPQTSPQGRPAWSHARTCHGWLISLSITLSQLSFLDRPRSRSADLYLQWFPFLLVATTFPGQNPRSRSVDLYLSCFPFRRTITSNDTSPYSIIIFLNLPLIATWVPP